ncbi:MAG: glutathione S-transferase family protein [Hyphomicrobiales bacterium]
MTAILYYGSGSPYAWRVWLALEHKQIPYELKVLSFDAGDLEKSEFLELNPRHKVPVLVDRGFVLYESAAIVEYVEERWPDKPRLFSADLRDRAVERRMIREADQYFAGEMERLVDGVLMTPKEKWNSGEIAAAIASIGRELSIWETMIGGDFLAGPLSAVDYTFYPELTIARRIARRMGGDLAMGPRMMSWASRMEELDIVKRTWPPHWK